MTLKKVTDSTPPIIVGFVKYYLPLCVILVTGGAWKASIEHQLTTNAEDDREHHNNKDLHMPKDVKVAQFVPRHEWVDQNNRIFKELGESDQRQREIMASLARIEERTKELNQ